MAGERGRAQSNAPDPSDDMSRWLVSAFALTSQRLMSSLKLNHGDFRAAVEAEMIVANITNPGINVERPGGRLKQALVVLVHPVRNDHGTVKGNAHLPTVGMSGQHEVGRCAG
jgi:hypothetical protein